jgi:hypothetical protein
MSDTRYQIPESRGLVFGSEAPAERSGIWILVPEPTDDLRNALVRTLGTTSLL